jgi:hypothetical protein
MNDKHAVARGMLRCAVWYLVGEGINPDEIRDLVETYLAEMNDGDS